MCSPMYDVPEHMMIPVDVNGDGPAEGKEIDHYECWCGDKTCDKELVELRAAPDRVNTDPVVVSCAVRYALGRLSYLPGMIADEVRRTWPHLGHQRDVIAKDITEWLAEPWRHDQRPGFEDTVTVWSDLAAWIDRQTDTDTGRTE